MKFEVDNHKYFVVVIDSYIDNGTPVQKEISLNEYCQKVGRKNNSLLFLLEARLSEELGRSVSLKEEKFCDIRKIILSTSGNLSRIPKTIKIIKEEF